MGYMIPLRFINVSTKPKVAICATRIVTMMSTDIYQARRTIHDEKKAGTLINACSNNAAKTAILLDNGTVVSSPMTISVLMNAIEKSNIKASKKNTTQRLRVYDVYDEEPSPEDDEEVLEASAYDNEDAQDDEDDYDDDFDD